MYLLRSKPAPQDRNRRRKPTLESLEGRILLAGYPIDPYPATDAAEVSGSPSPSPIPTTDLRHAVAD